MPMCGDAFLDHGCVSLLRENGIDISQPLYANTSVTLHLQSVCERHAFGFTFFTSEVVKTEFLVI